MSDEQQHRAPEDAPGAGVAEAEASDPTQREEEDDEEDELKEGVHTTESGVTELRSLCMNCHETATTRLMMVKIPSFREVIVMSTSCGKCGYKTTEAQNAGEIQPHGCRYTLTVTTPEVRPAQWQCWLHVLSNGRVVGRPMTHKRAGHEPPGHQAGHCPPPHSRARLRNPRQFPGTPWRHNAPDSLSWGPCEGLSLCGPCSHHRAQKGQLNTLEGILGNAVSGLREVRDGEAIWAGRHCPLRP